MRGRLESLPCARTANRQTRPLRPAVNLPLDLDNLTNVPQRRDRGISDQVEYFNCPGTTITVGTNGRC